MDRTEERSAPEDVRTSKVWTLPNVLSMSRILLTPFFVGAMIQRRPWPALGFFLLASVTDALDGFTARHFHLKSNLGLWLDPAADKILLTSAFIVLSLPGLGEPNVLPLWLTATVVGRDLLLAVGTFIYIGLRGRTVFRPTLLGKASTVSAVATIFAVLLANALGEKPAFLPWLYVLTAVLAGSSGVYYIGRGIVRFFREKPPVAG
ncbi:MAG TPA: CDP-alcohol phosphatidyltransferase family protein [Terriglobales bacterium]|nr:CDP-alcohol phosphatidyltransferase family protein [Terriglobales bacterium]